MRDKALKIIDNLNGRCGFDDWWDMLDDDIKEEIIEEIVEALECD